MNVRGLHHVAISTPDADRLAAFYRDVLGFEVVFDQTWPPGTEVADRITGLDGSSARQLLLQMGNAYLELFEFRAPAARPGDPERPVCDHGYTHLCVDVEHSEAAYERLRSLGVTALSAPQDIAGEVCTFYARDPDGNVVEFQELRGRAADRFAA